MDQPESIVIASCEREKPYVDTCLRSMLADGSVRRVSVVVCGSSSTNYLDGWRTEGRVETVGPTDAERDAAVGKGPTQRTILTTSRALDHASGDGPTLFFEDDAIFGKRWLERARGAARKLTERHGERFLLALYSPYTLPRDKPLVPYHPSNFYGNVGLWLPAATARAVAERMRAVVISGKFKASDIIVKGWLWKSRTPAYAMSPSVVNHMGDRSTRGRTIIIRAPSYLG